jgi:catalase
MIDGGPSVLFDAVVLLGSEEGFTELAYEACAKDFVSDAFAHLKFIAYTEGALPLLAKAGVMDDPDEGVMALDSSKSIDAFVVACRNLRLWSREADVKLS